MENIFAAFPAILEQIEANPDAREAFVFAAWRRSVGDLLNEQTVPAALSESRLRIAVSSETWRRHLEDMAGQILFKLNAKLASSSVKFLEFFVDEKVVTANRRSHHRDITAKDGTDPQIAKEITADLRNSAAAIENKELREAFLLAAGSCLARRTRISKQVK